SKPIFFQWLKNGHVLNEDDEIKIESSEDVSLFTIKHVKLNDAGNYTCVAKNAIGADSSTVVLTVKVPLRWTKEPQDTAVKLEERLQIECDAFGVPKPKIKWFSKEGEIIGDKLRFDKISVSDKGSFVCVAENGFDQPLKKAINIYVNTVFVIFDSSSTAEVNRDAPRIVPISHRSVESGSDIRLFCGVEKGSQPLYFEWRKDEIPLTISSYPNNFKISDKTELSLLHINNAKIENEGNYTCSVKNDVGSDSVTVLLTVKMAPKWIKEPKDITVTMGESVSIECDAIASPKPTIYWRHLNTNENTKSKVLKINAVKESNSGKYECVVSNKHGDLLKKTISVTVSVPAKFEEKYALIHAKSGESAKLSCNAIGDKPLAVTWIKESKLDKRGGENYEIFDHVTEHGLNSELVIRSVKREDEYLYKCLAENEYGSDEKTVKLVVI
ncbi:hemicentin-1-like protein, partial [Dinothrombium tinctorium]